MKPQAVIITPVKDSIETTIQAAAAISKSSVSVEHLIFDDFSSTKSVSELEKYKNRLGYKLIHLSDHTKSPSPNYKLVLQMAQKYALSKNLPLIVVESDVFIKKNTVKSLLNFEEANPDAGLVGAITVDNQGEINFPYLKFKRTDAVTFSTDRSLSFCCTLMSLDLLKSFNFTELDQSKHWFDTFISKKSKEVGFQNYVLKDLPVVHQPHSSRPWKQMKYSNPFKYYLDKMLNGRDRI